MEGIYVRLSKTCKFVLLRDIGISKRPYSLCDQFCGISNIEGKIVFLRSRFFPITPKEIGHIFLCDLLEYSRHFVAWILRGATLNEEAQFLIHNPAFEIITVKNVGLNVRLVRNPVMRHASSMAFNLSFFEDKGGKGYNHSLTFLYGRPEALDEFVDARSDREFYAVESDALRLQLAASYYEYAIGVIYYDTFREDVNGVPYKLRFGMLLESKLVQEINHIKRFGSLLQSYQESIFDISSEGSIHTEFLGNDEEESIFDF